MAPLACGGVPAERMNREQFYGRLAGLDAERLKKALWTLYWRGSASVRERIEAEIAPEPPTRDRSRSSRETVDPALVLAEVREFAALARAGAYMAGDRRVSPRERTRWRFTFRRLVNESLAALCDENLTDGAAALEQLIDLACHTRSYDYFRSDDPIEAAGVVVSDTAATLWKSVYERHGFTAFADRAAPQLIRWESRYGWTRSGFGRISEKETSLASVLAGMLPATDMWAGFTDRYLAALDQISGAAVGAHRSRAGRDRAQRAADLADWHQRLLDRLTDTDAEDRLDTLIRHPALAGPELTHLQARLTHQRGDVVTARTLAHECLQELPGHPGFLDFAIGIGADLPPAARQILDARLR